MNVRHRAANLLGSRRFPYAAALLAMVLALPALRMGFFADDFMQRATFLQPDGLDGMFGKPFADFFTFADGDPVRAHQFADRGLYPWLSYPEALFRFWRPATVATHWVDYQLWPDSAVLMHVHNLMWFGAMVLAVAFFYRRMIGSGVVAGLAGLLYAIDDAHAWPAAWIANRNGLIAVALGIGVLTLHDRWRRERQPLAVWLAVPLLGLALLAKESALSVCGYLFAYALFIDGGSARSRMLSLIPYGVVVVIWRIVYVSLGYGAADSGGYIDPAREPLQFAGALVERVPVLMQGLWWLPPSDYYGLGPISIQPYLWTVGVIGTLALVPLLWPLVRRDALARFWCLGMVLAILPVSSGGPQDRLLLFPGIGAMGLIAQWLVEYRSGALFREGTARLRSFARPAFGALVFVHFVVAPIGLPGGILALTWINDNTIMAAQATLPESPDITDKTFVFINVANYPIATYLYIVRGAEERPVPAHVRSFAPVSMAAVPITLTRTDDSTVVVEPDGGYPWSLFRSTDHPFNVGDRVELTGMTAEVVTLAEGGWPQRVAYRFDVPLEDPSLMWFVVVGIDFIHVQPPAIGETVEYDPIDLLREERGNPIAP